MFLRFLPQLVPLVSAFWTELSTDNTKGAPPMEGPIAARTRRGGMDDYFKSAIPSLDGESHIKDLGLTSLGRRWYTRTDDANL